MGLQSEATMREPGAQSVVSDVLGIPFALLGTRYSAQDSGHGCAHVSGSGSLTYSTEPSSLIVRSKKSATACLCDGTTP